MLNWVEHEKSFITSGPAQVIVLPPLPEIANYSKKIFILSKVYTYKSGMKILLKLVDYLLIQSDKPLYNCYVTGMLMIPFKLMASRC